MVKSQPIPDIPVYEVIPENPRARKTRLLHRILLLPFSSISPPVDRRKSSSSSPDEPPNTPDSQSVIGDIPPPVELLDPSSGDSDGGYDASASSCSQAGDEIDVVDTTTSSTAYDGNTSFLCVGNQVNPALNLGLLPPYPHQNHQLKTVRVQGHSGFEDSRNG